MVGTTDPVEGIGIVPISFLGSNHLYLLEALSWLRAVSREGNSVQVPIIPIYHKTELQDYVSINVHTLPEKMTGVINLDIHHPKI